VTVDEVRPPDGHVRSWYDWLRDATDTDSASTRIVTNVAVTLTVRAAHEMGADMIAWEHTTRAVAVGDRLIVSHAQRMINIVQK